MTFGTCFKNLLGIKCVKHYSYPFRFDIFTARCLGGPFFTGHSVFVVLVCFCVLQDICWKLTVISDQTFTKCQQLPFD